MVRIIAVQVPPVKTYRLKARKPGHPFGRGILASRPTTRVDATVADVQWWAVETATAEDAHYDRLADEAAFLDRYTRGLSD